MIEVKIRLDEGATMPHQANATDSGYDLVATSVRYDEEGDFLEYGTGVYLDIPEGYHALLYPRSSISKYHLFLCNGVGVVDELYKKEILLRFKIPSDYDVLMELDEVDGTAKVMLDTNDKFPTKAYAKIYRVGDKIAQIVIEEKAKYKLTQVDAIEDSGRGGFGSSDTILLSDGFGKLTERPASDFKTNG